MPSTGLSRPSEMPERFLDLDRTTQGEIILGLAPAVGRAPAVIEKDIWVCWALRALFTMPGRIRRVGTVYSMFNNA